MLANGSVATWADDDDDDDGSVYSSVPKLIPEEDFLQLDEMDLSHLGSWWPSYQECSTGIPSLKSLSGRYQIHFDVRGTELCAHGAIPWVKTDDVSLPCSRHHPRGTSFARENT